MKKILLSFCLSCLLFLSTACGKKENLVSNNSDVYSFLVGNTEIFLGDKFDEEKLGYLYTYSETPSCAFDGLDKTYTYQDYEITTYPNNEEDLISSIYFLTDAIQTKEGVKLGDNKTKMLDTYGDNYQEKDNIYTYVKNKTSLEFMLQDDVIISIEYVYNLD